MTRKRNGRAEARRKHHPKHVLAADKGSAGMKTTKCGGWREDSDIKPRREVATYSDFRIRLQRKRRKLCLLLVRCSDSDGILRADSQRELLAAHRDTCDGLEARLEVRYAP